MNDKNKNTATDISQSILATEDLTKEPVSIPEWNFEGYLREVDGEAAFYISQIARQSRDKKTDNAYILEAWVCASLCDQDGNLVFTMDQRAALAKKKPAIIERLYSRIEKINGLGEDEVDALVKK